MKHLQETTSLLERTSPALNALLAGLPNSWVQAKEKPGGWSAFDVLGHLVDGELEDWIPRVKIILEFGEDQPFTVFDRESHLGRPEESLAERLHEFEKLRRQNLLELKRLCADPKSLALFGTHPEFGAVTMAQLIYSWGVHDLAHLAQIARVLAQCYVQDVGPWRAYLPILG